MNPNRLSRELRDLPGNVRSGKLPGGSIISAVLDRNLMTWSDRGGASRIFGELWSEYSWQFLTSNQEALPQWARNSGQVTVLRLDANPKIAIQAGRNKLPNPDFLIATGNHAGTIELRAIDAKFAIDRLRRTQVSAEAVRALVELSSSLTQVELFNRTNFARDVEFSYEPGAFLAPRSLLNDYFYRVQTEGQDPKIPASELVLVEADPLELFARSEESNLMHRLRQLDSLDVMAPPSDIVAQMYYLRLACAARWFEHQIQSPLLSNGEFPGVDLAVISEEFGRRSSRAESAYDVIRRWARSADAAAKRQDRVREAAKLPLRMSELRRMMEAAQCVDSRKKLRLLRGALEVRFRSKLVELVGEIPNQPNLDMDEVISRIQNARRHLRESVIDDARALVEQAVS